MENYNIENFKSDFLAVEEEVSKAIIGQKNVLRNVLAAIIAGGNVLLEGLPGLGKTEMIKTVGKVLDLQFSRIQFTPDLMPADVTGTDIISPTGGFEFQKGPVFSNIVLADEINRATPKTQSSLLEAMQEKTVTVGRNTYKLPDPFFVLATQNPIEMEGTYPLPEAQMDRFMIKLNVDMPTIEELKIIVDITAVSEIEDIKKIFDGERIKAMRLGAKTVALSEQVMDYAMAVVMMTQPTSPNAPEIVKKYVNYGSSPRGAQAIINISRIYALLDSRYNVAYEDINKAIFICLGHRLFLGFEALAEGIEVKRILSSLIHK